MFEPCCRPIADVDPAPPKQSVQGENGTFMVLNMDTGEASMRALEGLETNHQVSMVD